jgi:hypothetical protein
MMDAKPGNAIPSNWSKQSLQKWSKLAGRWGFVPFPTPAC